jgi:predicted O-methyltransferase YrrM
MTTMQEQQGAVSMPDVMIAVGRLQTAVDALAAIGARASAGDDMPADVDAAIDAVLAAAGLPDVRELAPPQRAMVAGFVRTAFGQATNLFTEPNRPAGWTYTDPAVLEGLGRGSMLVPPMLAQTGEFGDVTSFLDVGTGVGLLAVSAAQVWPNCTVVGIDTWEPSLEQARRNVAESGLGDRIELRRQNVTDLDDRDRYDLTWVPGFFVSPGLLPAAFERIRGATAPGGQIVIARYDPPPDPLAEATMRMRVIRDGGSWIEASELVALLEAAGWTDTRIVPKPGGVPLTFVAGRKS